MYITDERKPLVFSLIILGLTALSALVPIISSSFYTQSDSLFLIFLTALILTVSVCAASFFDTFTVFGFALASAMMIASTAAIPLLFFTSAYSDEAVYSFTTECFSAALVTVVAVPATWLMILVVNAMRKKFPAVIEIAAIAVSILLGIVVFAFSDRSSNTTLVFGVQIALPIASFMPIVIALSASSNLFKLRIFTALSAVLCIASLVINRETGVPIMLYIAFTVWYLIFCPTKNKLVTLIVVAAPIIGIIGMFLYGKIIVHIIDIGFLTNIYNMIHDRVFSDDLYQINCAVSSIQRGSFFGINSYSYVPEGTSDLLFTTVLHYLGAGFLVLFSALLIPFVVSGAKRFTAYGYGFTSYLSGLSFVLIITFSLYNLLMCVGAAPIIGIQQPFMGFSGTQALFSGILLGSCTYPKGKIIFAKQA